ncbi:MAG: hypothetical protein BWX97_01801 [Firmicutes bacterium ADurb.Bin146]|nr:MAG: hypothetical protein BWX97_01801 [Firmicutes bacterium ADurb.Bin146]
MDVEPPVFLEPEEVIDVTVRAAGAFVSIEGLIESEGVEYGHDSPLWTDFTWYLSSLLGLFLKLMSVFKNICKF